MKLFLLSFFLCVFHVSLAQDGGRARQLGGFQTRPLHRPEAQNSPVIVPVPVYTPVQQYPVQQHPLVQQYPVQYPQYSFQQHPRPQVYHVPPQYHHHQYQGYPQYPQMIPC